MSNGRTSPARGCGRALFPAILLFSFLTACSQPAQRPTGPARVYDDAKDMFKRGRFDRVVEFTGDLARMVPPGPYTERARVLQVVVYSGVMQGYKILAEAYAKGAQETKNTRFQAEYKRITNDVLRTGAQSALGLGETAHLLTEGGQISNELVLEAPYPTIEGPFEVAQLVKVRAGGWIEPDQQDAAAVDAQRKGIDDALAAVVGGDRPKAQAALAAGPVKISGVDFALYLGNQLVDAASFFDRKHLRDYPKFRTLLTGAEEAAKAAQAQVKQNPNAEKEKAVKKLQDQIKAALKAT
jgi:hypothetical protein